MPTRWPVESTSAPPELPWLMAASVWMKFSNMLMPRFERPSADTIPIVTVWPTSNGLPIASTMSPTLQRVVVAERDDRQPIGLDLQNREVALGICAHQPRVELASVGERDRDLVGCLHDVVVGQDVAISGGNHSGAEARDAFGPAARVAEEVAVERIGRSAATLHFACVV